MTPQTRLLIGIGLVLVAYAIVMGGAAFVGWWDARMERRSGYNRETLRARRDDDEPRCKKIYGIRSESYPNAR